MIRAVVFFLVSALFTESKTAFYDNPVAHFTVADSVNIEINAIYDSLGVLSNYNAHIITPVCEEDKCYAIEVDFYWDQIGRFHHYDTVPGKGLTKLDHDPFTESDFIKLKNILNNSNSILASYTKEELVRNTRSSDVDGVSGATIKEIQESVINGAVYSCFTLWHIANGLAVDSLQKVTKKLFSRELIKNLVIQDDQEINYFLINSFSERDFTDYLPEILQTILQGKGYYAKNAVEKIPSEILSNILGQGFFATNFTRLDYFAQVAFLKKISTKSINEDLKTTLRNNVDNRNSYKNDLIKVLLDDVND
ncbi:MAG: hypothetical protein O2951_10285 [Bacteroidetes bacterium]|nr:hypothetical protein [Bacteroidota bacterium]